MIQPDHHQHMLDPELARVLAHHSPRLPIARPALIPYSQSPTGWLLIEPAAPDEVNEAQT